jgi:hypothetical protein
VKKNNDLTGNKNELAAIDDLEINALTDDELNAVAGGFLDKNTTTTASCQCCVAGATNQTPPKTT